MDPIYNQEIGVRYCYYLSKQHKIRCKSARVHIHAASGRILANTEPPAKWLLTDAEVAVFLRRHVACN